MFQVVDLIHCTKRCCQTLLVLPSHVECSLSRRFGASANAENTGSRKMIAEVKKAIEHCHKSHKTNKFICQS